MNLINKTKSDKAQKLKTFKNVYINIHLLIFDLNST